MSVLIRDLILAAYRGFTGPVYRMTAATGVALLPARAKPPQILAAEIAAAAAFVLTLVALLTRRALPPAERRLVYVWVRVNIAAPQNPPHPFGAPLGQLAGADLDNLADIVGAPSRKPVVDTTAIEVVEVA